MVTWKTFLSNESDLQTAADKLATHVRRLKLKYCEMDDAVHFAVSSALTGLPCLLIAAPGTAKSALIGDIAKEMFTITKADEKFIKVRNGGGPLAVNHFQIALNKTTMPDELMGPLDVSKLKNGQYIRNIRGKAPSAFFVFVDEVSRGNSATRDALLTLMNEKKFVQDGVSLSANLFAFYGATNFIPEEPSEGAFLDRFVYKVQLEYLHSADSYMSMCGSNGVAKELAALKVEPLSLREWLGLRYYIAEHVEIPDEMIRLGIGFQSAMEAKLNWKLSNRRFKQVFAKYDNDRVTPFASVLKAEAFLEGFDVVHRHHIAHALTATSWTTPESIPQINEVIAESIDSTVGNAMALYNEMLSAFEEVERGSTNTAEIELISGMKAMLTEIQDRAIPEIEDDNTPPQLKARLENIVSEAELLVKSAMEHTVSHTSRKKKGKK